MLKNTTARERNQIKGERKNLEKKEKIGSGNNWKERKKLGELDKIGRIGKVEKN